MTDHQPNNHQPNNKNTPPQEGRSVHLLHPLQK